MSNATLAYGLSRMTERIVSDLHALKGKLEANDFPQHEDVDFLIRVLQEIEISLDEYRLIHRQIRGAPKVAPV